MLMHGHQEARTINFKKTARRRTMVFRKRRMHRSTSRAGRFYRKHNPSTLGVWDVLIAGAIYGAVRPTIANAIPTFFSFGSVDSDNVILGGAGYLASRSHTKMIKALGLIAMGTEAGIVTSGLISGATKGNNTPSYDSY